MNAIANFSSNRTMNNLDLLKLINTARAQCGEKMVRLNDFNARIVDELDEGDYETFVVENSNKTTSKGFNLTIEQCILIGMRESKFVRKNVLETLKHKQEPTKLEILKMALESEQQRLLLEEQIAVLAPKAMALDVIADTTHTYCIRECAKTIGIRESELIQLLIDKKWMYRDSAKKLQPHSQYVTNGVFINRTSPVIASRTDGQERVFLHMRVTAFGLTRITGLVNKSRAMVVAA